MKAILMAFVAGALALATSALAEDKLVAIDVLLLPDERMHVTTGTGPLKWVEAREGEPFEKFEFGVLKLAVFKLGNFGTAAAPLGE